MRTRMNTACNGQTGPIILPPQATTTSTGSGMTSFYDEVEIEDMEFDEENDLYFYPCPCGDRFQLSLVSIVSESSNHVLWCSCPIG